MKPFHKFNARLDVLGTTASLACALHCALMPILIGLLPWLGFGFLGTESSEWIFTIFSIALGCVSLMLSFKKYHQRLGPCSLFGGGVACLLGARLLLADDSSWELPLVVGGALLVASAHLLNLRHCRYC